MPGRLARLAAVAVVCLIYSVSDADRGTQAVDKQDAAGAKCVRVEGALVELTKDGFKPIKVGQRIPLETLIVGLPEAELTGPDGKILIKLLVYIGEALPVTEAAVIFHASADKMPEFTLERGVVAIKQAGGKGPASVRVRAGKQAWEITLKDADSEVLIARFGRHEPGVMRLLQAGQKKTPMVDEPLMHFGTLVVKGHAVINTGTHTYSMTAPPGPAMAAWDSGAGLEIKRLEVLPEEVRGLDPTESKAFKEVCDITGKLAAGDIGKGLDELIASDNPVKRRVAVACMGAFDDLPRLWAALENPKHNDVRDQAIHVLRNWVGRKPGQLTKLQEHLEKTTKYTPVQIRNFLGLLKGFDDQDRKEPIIYQLLINALEFAPLPGRQMAHWHLERLAPAGQKIAYDAAADEASRHQAVLQWRRLIPEGQLPPAPKQDDSKKGKG